MTRVKLLVGILLFLTALATAATVIQNKMFRHHPELSDFLFTQHQLFEMSASAELDCARLCVRMPYCVSFTFRAGSIATPGVCRGHNNEVTVAANSSAVAAGSRTFIRWRKNISGTPTNVAVDKVTWQSSTHYGFGADRAVDGNMDPDHLHGSCTHTRPGNEGIRNWWLVDLGTPYAVISVIVTSRSDCQDECALRLRDFDTHIYMENPIINPAAASALCHHFDGPMETGVTENLLCYAAPITGRFVKITNAPEMILSLCEVQVMAVPPDGNSNE